MSGQFTLGEIAILQNLPAGLSHLNRMECEIVGPLQIHRIFDLVRCESGYCMGYEIRVDGSEFVVNPYHLKKKRPPTADTGEMRVMQLFTKPPVKQLEPELA